MPRGRKSTVRYYFDSVTGSVIAVAKEGIRVLQEIMPGTKKAPARGGKRRGRPPGSKSKKSQAGTEGAGETPSTATPKRRGRAKKSAA
jgi:hypothetical protein